jgi:hypothetical protein
MYVRQLAILVGKQQSLMWPFYILIMQYPSIADLQVNTVKIDGSGWSYEIEPIVL